MTTITALPTAPSRADPANFRTRADAFMAALPTFATETNTVAGEVNTNASNAATSASTATTQAGIATTQAGITTTQAGIATTKAAEAVASALTAVNAPGTSATSVSGLAVGTGSKSLTIQTGKAISVGMFMTITSTASPENWMHGEVTSYDSGTGALIINVETAAGAGTISAWTVAVSGPKGPTGQAGASLSGATTLDLTSGNATLTSASDQVQTITAAVSGRAINLPDSTSMTEGGFPFIIINKTGHSVALKNSSGTVVRVVGGGVVSLCAITDAATNAWACYQFANEMVVNLGAVFNSGSTSYTSIAMLDSSTAIVCYADVSNSYYGMAQILRIDGGAIIAAQSYETVFSSASTSNVSVVAIDSTHALVTYAISGYGKAMVLTVSGNSISTNTAATFNSAQTTYGKVALLDSTHAIVAYSDDSVNYGKACVLSVSGTSISPGTPATFVSANTGDLGLAVLDSTHAIVTYADGGASSYGKACVLSVSGTSISPGTPATFEAASSSEPHVATLSASKAVVAYKVGGGVSYNKTCVLDVSGTSVLPGASVTLNSGSNAGYYFSIAAMASDRAVLAYSYSEVGVSYGVAQMLNISGTTVVPGALTVFRNAAVAYLGITAMDSGKVVVTYQDAGLSSYGVASVLSNL